MWSRNEHNAGSVTTLVLKLASYISSLQLNALFKEKSYHVFFVTVDKVLPPSLIKIYYSILGFSIIPNENII